MALAGLAATELFRQPACLLLILGSNALIILVPVLVAHQLGQTEHLAVDSSLAFTLVFGIILAGYAACSTLHNECRSGTILIVFSKPVGRLLFFLAKAAAVSLMLAFFVYCSAAASLLAERLSPRNFEFDATGSWLLLATPFTVLVPPAILNFRTRRSFVPYSLAAFALTLTAWVLVLGALDRDGHRAVFGSFIEWRILPASLMEGFALLIMAAIALSLATRLPTPTTVAILAVILFAGLISDHLVSQLPAPPFLQSGLRTILPDIQAFWPADKIGGGGVITPPLLAHAALYALTYGAGIMCLGYAAFRNRQF